MHAGKLVFAQVMEFAPWKTFSRLVSKFGGDANVRTFRCMDQFLCMSFAQLTYRESLRDIEACLGAQPTKLYHLGIRGNVTRSNLADANESRDWRIYENFAYALIRIARRLYACLLYTSLDFHHGSRRVLTVAGQWIKPLCLCVMDDCSRLVCHAQWYANEDTRCLVHGFCQALLKRGLPRSLLTDNGAAMVSEEFTCGLHRLSIVHETTLPYAAYQNGKQETLWASVEGRLMAMLEGVQPLTLAQLNEATCAWVEQEYHRAEHRELKATPLARFLHGPCLLYTSRCV